MKPDTLGLPTVSVDANASVPVHPKAWQAYEESSSYFANPYASHRAGRAARQSLEKSRATVAEVLGAFPDEIVFTSGGTESDALALQGLWENPWHPELRAEVPHCISTSIEHAAVRVTLQQLEQRGVVNVDWVAVPRTGQVQVEDVVASFTPRTRLVSVIAASNETGVLQPISVLGPVCRKRGVVFHTDAVQLVGKIPVDVQAWQVDLLSLSGHKLGAVGGMGALYVRRGMALRSGSTARMEGFAGRDDLYNIPGAASLAAALVYGSQAYPAEQLESLRDTFETMVKEQVGSVEIWGEGMPRLPHTSCIRFIGCKADGLMMALDLEGFATSTGSACSSGSIDPSPVLLGMGLDRRQAQESLRFSWHSPWDPATLTRLVTVLARLARCLRQDVPATWPNHPC